MNRRRGFTLIELLIVIAIIATLIAILVSAAHVPKLAVRTSQLQNSLMAALESYKAHFGAYPPSDNGSIGTGAQCLYYYLMGPREQGWGPNSADGGIAAQMAWGPAKELDEDWMVGGGPGTGINRKFFCDGGTEKDKAMLYYRANINRVPIGNTGKTAVRTSYDEVYNRADNNGPDDSPFWTPPADQWADLIINPYSYHKAPYRPTSYLLIGAGEDRVFGFVDGKSDDILGPSLKRND